MNVWGKSPIALGLGSRADMRDDDGRGRGRKMPEPKRDELTKGTHFS